MVRGERGASRVHFWWNIPGDVGSLSRVISMDAGAHLLMSAG